MPFTDDPDAQIRLTDARYADGEGAPVAGGDPVAVSTQIFDQDGDIPNSAGLSNLFVAWGQFLDHDLTLTPETEDEVLTADGLVAPLHRSEFELDEDGARLPTNAITWQLDGSQIYGSSAGGTAALRSFESGHLRMQDDAMSDSGLMPDADPDSPMAGAPGEVPVFLAGDVRANENPALNAMHTLMAREHNYWADRLAEENPDWTDDQLFDAARSIVEYELQSITYNEWLPHLVGDDALGEDTGYDPDVNGQVSVEFSTAAFRFGHTMVSSRIALMEEDGSESDYGDMAIQDAFFNPEPLRAEGIDTILRGQASTFAQESDTQVVDDLNFFLSTPGGMTGFSLVALNVLRGQDHGLQSYIDTRATLLGDIDPATLDPLDFSIITSDEAVQAQLASVYATVHDVDLWVGGLAEDDVDGGQMGPLFTHIIAEQFTRTRAADESFGQLDPGLSDAIIAEVQGSTLSDIIGRNTEIDLLQDDVFVATDRGLTVAEGFEGTDGDDSLDLVALDIEGDVATGAGNDTVTMTGGTRIAGTLSLGDGDDVLNASSGSVDGWFAQTGAGHDTVTLSGSADFDALSTGAGDDEVAVTQGAAVGDIYTGHGADQVSVGGRASVGAILTGGEDDLIRLEDGADVGFVDGGSGHDTLRLDSPNFRIDWTDEARGDGRVVYLNEDGTETGQYTDFHSIETVPCFTPGTKLISACGAVPIETLKVGDRIYTLDGGLQPIVWIGKITVLAEGDNAPIRIAEGALGNTRAMEVSPQHRMMLDGWQAEVICGTDEVLAPARHLLNDRNITRRTGGTVDYIHVLFADHQIVIADGIPSESFHPGATGLQAMAEASRAEILRLFPQLEADLDGFGPAARYSATPREILAMRCAKTPS